MRRWLYFIFQGRPFSGSNRRWWAGVAEAVLGAALLLAGVICFVVSITLAVLRSTPEATLYISVWFFVAQILVAVSLVGVGSYWIVRLLWQVGVSAERRGALTTRANELELLNEIRQRREDLPTVPRDAFPPKAGQKFDFRLVPSPRNVWGLVTSTLASVILVALVTVLVLIVTNGFFSDSVLLGEIEKRIGSEPLDQMPDQPWLAAALLIPICLVTGWSVYQFFRQLLKLTGIGATSIELSGYPLLAGESFQVFLSQTARVRLKLLDVALICFEEVTFNQGTDIRTERVVVYEERLFRQRGIEIRHSEPFETEFALTIPNQSMHSFKSPNNRVQWKIVVTAQAKNWPRLKRNFAVTVHPPGLVETQTMKS